MIRQPGHEAKQVIGPEVLESRLAGLTPPRPLRLATACRHVDLKGLDLLIRAVALLRQRGVSVEVSLYGGGPRTASLRALAATLGVEDRIEFPGPLAAGEELDLALRKSDLFLMPHRTSDFGRAFFDAMAAGLPVLAFRTPASVDTVYEGLDGFLSPLDDVQGLAERIAFLEKNRSMLAAASRGARQRAMENTRSEWFRLRAQWTLSMMNEGAHAAV
jgi:glycosyltransferase involved in cell wall biosynthesis